MIRNRFFFNAAALAWALAFVIAGIAPPAEAQQCASAGQFKGLELYSWPARDGWMLSLVPGTNRAKATEEIKSHPCRGSVEQMLVPLSRLGAGQQVFWFHRRIPGFEYPPDNVIDRVAASAQRAGVELHGPPREGIGPAPGPQGSACNERARELEQRKATLERTKEAADRETFELQRKTVEMDNELRTVDGKDRATVAEYNARAAEHTRRVDAHNRRIAQLNAGVAELNAAIDQHAGACGGGLRLRGAQ